MPDQFAVELWHRQFVQPGDAQAQTPALQTWVFGCNSPDFAWEAQEAVRIDAGPEDRSKPPPTSAEPDRLAAGTPLPLIMPIVGELEARRVRPGFCAGLRVRRESDGARIMDRKTPARTFRSWWTASHCGTGTQWKQP